MTRPHPAVCGLLVAIMAARAHAESTDEVIRRAGVDDSLAVSIIIVLMEVALVIALIAQTSGRRTRDQAPSRSDIGREVDDRFRRLANALPVGVWRSDIDGARTFVNRTWLDMTGRPIECELGAGWAEAIHGDDRARCLTAYARAVTAREPFSMEYRIRRHDGQYRWLLDNGVPHYDVDMKCLGYIGGTVDFTDQRTAQNALRHLDGKLIAAQEHERRRIARDLHDSVSQRMALIALGLDELRRRLPATFAESEILARLDEGCATVAREVHALSHRLHSAKLDALGLVATVAGHCRELSAQGFLVEFSAVGVPDVPYDAALCLFRIAQEALANAVKHSGVTKARVTMSCVGDVIVLHVEDDGTGFVPAEAGEGLGLVSMRERVGTAGGDLVIRSTPGRGTAVEARVPISIPLQAPIRQSELSRVRIENVPPLLVLSERSESTSG